MFNQASKNSKIIIRNRDMRLPCDSKCELLKNIIDFSKGY